MIKTLYGELLNSLSLSKLTTGTYVKRMLKLFLILLFIFITDIINCQQFNLLGPPGGGISGISIHPDFKNIIYTYGRPGVLYSSNDGISVEEVRHPFGNLTFTEIKFPYKDSNTVFAQVYNNSVKSSDRGKNWEIFHTHNSSYDKAFYEVNPQNSNTMFMSRDGTQIWKSMDLGKSWVRKRTFTEKLGGLAISPLDTSIVYCAADYGIYKSTDSGDTWYKILDTLKLGDGTKKITVNPLNDNSIYFIMGHYLHKSTSDGKNVQRLSNYLLQDYEVDPLDSNIIYMVISQQPSESSFLFKTVDGGNNWHSITHSFPQEDLYVQKITIDKKEPNNLYSNIGALGVFKTTDKGETWPFTNLSFSPVRFFSIVDSDEKKLICNTNGWGLSEYNFTTKSWTRPQFDISFDSLIINTVSFNPSNKSKGFAGGYYLFKTTDGGETWFRTQHLSEITALSFHPLQPDIILASDRYPKNDIFAEKRLHRSSDGGETWTKIMNVGVRDFVFQPYEPNIIYAFSYDKIYKSTDTGESWEVKTIGLNNVTNSFTSLVISEENSDLLYISSNTWGDNYNYFYKSTDGGETWQSIDVGLRKITSRPQISSILLDKNDPKRIMVGLTALGQALTSSYFNGGLYLTEDSGSTWKQIYDGEVNVLKADNSSPRNIYLGTGYGLIEMPDTFNVTSSQEIINSFPVEFDLLQNYPNPFNPQTTIRYNVAKRSVVIIQIYNLPSQKIATLVNEAKETGRYSVIWNGTNDYGLSVASGVYLYRFYAGDFVDTKKLMLIR
ncbi:MAG: T9SS type A sorting domain-containing protein [Bacteroidetes bacterium]|nr:T9SS type A sorting domain-containing protein [Bacteroidota bacterium]